MNKVRGYIFSRPFMGERVPQHVQNIVIREYCGRMQLQYLLSATEYAMQGCYLMLEQALSELPELSGLVLYSLFQLPDNPAQRKDIFSRIVSQKKTLHFAVEGLSASTLHEFNRIEMLWGVRLTLSQCQRISKNGQWYQY